MRDSGADNELKRVFAAKQVRQKAGEPLGPQMIDFFHQSVRKRQGKFSQIADAWGKLVPQTLSEHCALESFSRGTLIVLVDSASHLYELKQLLLAGLQQQLLLACKAGGLRKISLKPGRWYESAEGQPQKLRFD